MSLFIGCSDSTSRNVAAEESDDLEGTWELAYYTTMEEGRVNPPNDGKPIYLDLSSDGTYEGRAGNNSILGNHRFENGNMILTYLTTEVARTEWENLFVESLQKSFRDSVYILPFVQIDSELILNYENNNTMHFVQRTE